MSVTVRCIRRSTSGIATAVMMAAVPFGPFVTARAQAPVNAGQRALPERLTDAEFWKLQSDISEPGGFFRNSDNFTSNEMEIGQLFTALRNAQIGGGVYVGVGPEQNFSYIASIRPRMAFVIDIRRQAVVQHLMFKAIFELSGDRAGFISLLFSKPRPAGLDSATSIQRIWDAYRTVVTDTVLASRNYARIRSQLLEAHRFLLTQEELGMLEWVWRAFTQYGPGITTNAGSGRNSGGFDNLTGYSADAAGQPQSFLSSEENYRFVRSLHEKNLIVPVSGDFAGPKALRAIGSYVADRGATISAYYVSNVEQYLFQDGKQAAFYANVATLPVTPTSVFIRPYAMRGRYGTASRPLCPIAALVRAFTTGRAYAYEEALGCVQ